MDIKRAKQEIKDTIEAYLLKDEYGEYCIPSMYQRPVLLMGAPGIGKTRIVEQISKEMKIGLVAYTITHHTRQSAVGLPYAAEQEYDGQICSVTEYTTSEVISAIYDKMEQTGIREGILFLDEISSVPDAMSPIMLQCLQSRTFGSQSVPDGWVIVAAGSPPEYHRFMRDMDVGTLDRLKRMDVTADLSVWKEYAHRQQIHPAILSYLELRGENFYRMEHTSDGRFFVTARGWEDLSRLIRVYEQLGKKVDQEIAGQYLQHPAVAEDFVNHLERCRQFEEEYEIDEILKGQWNPETAAKANAAPLDVRISLAGLLTGRLEEILAECYRMDASVAKTYEYLIYYRDNQSVMMMDDLRKMAEEDLERQKGAGFLTREQERIMLRAIEILAQFSLELTGELSLGDEAFDIVKEMFGRKKSALASKKDEAAAMRRNVLRFVEEAFGEDQETSAFVTEWNEDYYSKWFIRKKDGRWM